MGSAADAYPEDDIFSASVDPTSHHLLERDLVGLALARVVRPLALVQRILFFVHPERVLLARLTPHGRRLLKQDFDMARQHLQNNRFNYTMVGLPITLACGAPGMWAQLFPRLGLTEAEVKQDQLCFAHHPEGFASMACLVARHGASLRTLRVAVDLREEPASGAPAVGAAALLFSFLARGELPQLNHLTLVDSGGARAGLSSFLTPLARPAVEPLKALRTLRLSFAAPREHLGHLASFASRGGLPNLRNLVLFGDTPAEDKAIAELLLAIARPGVAHPLTSVDLSTSGAGLKTLEVLVALLERSQDCGRPPGLPPLSVQLEGTPAATRAEHEALYRRLQRFLPIKP